MTQGKIERWHRSVKNVVKLRNYDYPWELEQAVEASVQYYHHERYHESLENLARADVYAGKEEEVLSRREQIKQGALEKRRRQNLHWVHV